MHTFWILYLQELSVVPFGGIRLQIDMRSWFWDQRYRIWIGVPEKT